MPIRYLFLYFNPRSPCGERQIHWGRWGVHVGFQSTLPMRGATQGFPGRAHAREISIHAPHAGSDLEPLPPSRRVVFQSTLPMRGATWNRGQFLFHHAQKFQSTLPMRGATDENGQKWMVARFQSTLPMRGATAGDFPSLWYYGFQSTLPMRGATEIHMGLQVA